MGSITPASVGAAGIIALLMVLPGDLPAQDHRAALLAAERASSARSSDSGLVVAMRASVHQEGILLWPGAPVVSGADNVERFINALPHRDSLRLTWQPLGIELARDSSAGVTWGVALVTSRLAPSPPQVGRYIAAWRRDSGRWTTAALLILGIDPVSADMLPRGTRLKHDAMKPSGAAAPFVAADLAFARLAGESGAASAFRKWAAPDAFMFGDAGLLVQGPEAIGQAVAGPAAWRWHPVAAGAAQSGDLGWTVGEAVIAPQSAEPEYSKYLTVWIRRRGSPVKFLLDGGNARPATP